MHSGLALETVGKLAGTWQLQQTWCLSTQFSGCSAGNRGEGPAALALFSMCPLQGIFMDFRGFGLQGGRSVNVSRLSEGL